MKLLLIFTMLASSFTLTGVNNSQDSTQLAITNEPLQRPDLMDSVIITPLSRLEFALSITILAFGLIVILLEMILIKSKRISSEDTIKFIIITLIITSTLYLITAGYSNDQIAPAVGLLGTIAGYLLGRIQSNIKKNEKNEENN